MSDLVNEFQIDSNYLLWVTEIGESGNIYYIVSDKMRTRYFLFKGNKKLAKESANPLDLEKYIK